MTLEHDASKECQSETHTLTMADLNTFPQTCNEFRSDTFTTPSAEMVAVLFKTTYGDSVYQEDASTLAFERQVASLAGKPAGLFCVSGTMSNQIGLRVNLYQPPHLVVCDYRAHVFVSEAGGLASLSQAMVYPAYPANGDYITLEDVAKVFIADDGDIHGAPTRVISLENTLHGMIMPIDEIKRISEFARARGVRMHLDGARLWDASAATGVSIAEYCSHFDTVSLCISKSLGAPIGLVLVGPQDLITKANHFKKQCGGGIRQAGPLASMASYAVTHNVQRLKRAHQLAKRVGDFCKQHNIILKHPVDTSFVFVDFPANKMDERFFIRVAREKYNLKVMGSRLAFHFQLSDESVDLMIAALRDTLAYAKTNPYVPEGLTNDGRFYNLEEMSAK